MPRLQMQGVRRLPRDLFLLEIHTLLRLRRLRLSHRHRRRPLLPSIPEILLPIHEIPLPAVGALILHRPATHAPRDQYLHEHQPHVARTSGGVRDPNPLRRQLLRFRRRGPEREARIFGHV